MDRNSRSRTVKPPPIIFLSSNEASVLGQVWLKTCGWKGRQRRRRRRPTLIWAALKTTILLSPSTGTILSRWSYPHHSHLSSMWLEIIVRGSQPTWIQDEALRENKQSKSTFNSRGHTFFQVMMGTDKEGCVHSLWQLLLSYYLLNTLHFNFLSWHLHWSGKTEGIPPPFFFFPFPPSEVEVLLMLPCCLARLNIFT